MRIPNTDKRAIISQLFVDHRDRLQFYLRSLSASEDDARQLAQEAYLRMLGIKRRDFVRNPQAYLYRVARNLLHEWYSGQQIADDKVDLDLDRFEALEPSLTYLLGLRNLISLTFSIGPYFPYIVKHKSSLG